MVTILNSRCIEPGVDHRAAVRRVNFHAHRPVETVHFHLARFQRSALIDGDGGLFGSFQLRAAFADHEREDGMFRIRPVSRELEPVFEQRLQHLRSVALGGAVR